MTLPDHIRAFLGDRNRYATIGTIDDDGGPRQAVIWYRLDGDDLIINSLVGRRWPTNLLRDPRISVAVNDDAGGEHWVGISGTVEAIEHQPTAQADIAEMARRYNVDDPEAAEELIRTRFQTQVRISFRVTVAAVHDHLA